MKASIQFNTIIAIRVAAGLAAIALILSSNPIFAQLMTLPVDLSYLSQRADIIVQGKVLSVQNETLAGHSSFATVSVTLEVETMLRGPSAKTYTFREMALGAKRKMGKQSYRVGQRLVLFLPAPSIYGLSSPIGIEQGRFHIGSSAAGADMVINEVGNAGLFKSVAQKASKAGKKLTQEQLRTTSNERGPVRLDEFISLTKSLTSLPRIK
jgi:hypothetical protein